AVVYAIVLAAAAYTHPYSASIGFAHVLWSIRMRNWRAAVLGSLALAFVVGAFLPWYLWSREAWSEAIAAYRFQFSLKTPPMMFRELAGAGYWGSGLLGILCVLGMQTEDSSRRERWFFLSMVFVPITAILAANALFGYFIASRQFIWILPVVAVLAASAVERRGRFAVCTGVLLGATCIAISARFFMGPHENWEAAAQAIAGYSERQNACVVVSPPGSLRLYRYFRPELGRLNCDPARVVLVVTPYTPDKERASVIARLTAKGYRKLDEADIGNSLILRFMLAR
ncbi:MAG: hypothetical protein LC130_11910, partial [Bryobacterales bacterium]|nr:hypothetical protein [Bryobacterales bacterium]